MSERTKTYQHEKACADFVSTIANSKDLHIEQKLNILAYMADEMYCQDNNLTYLECKEAIKELRDKEDNRNNQTH